MPEPDEIWKAYTNYYTHRQTGNKQQSVGNYFRRKLRRLYKSILIRQQPVKRAREDVKYMYLRDHPPGRLLEVGCGSGRALKRFKDLGWQVEGQEVDPVAAQGVMEKLHVPVHVGLLDTLKLDGSKYDAVITNHVIEHVHDPVALITECYRLLKKGGTLVVVTPNIESFGHGVFKEKWLTLDPPRHLCLFTQRSLKNVALQSGFAFSEVWTTPANAEPVAAGSFDITTEGRHNLARRPDNEKANAAVLFQLAAMSLHKYLPDSGEECVLRARK
jgi:2-polyprenyl-3-methyl-5-hydroxy-6-metoxy-1,4-benzoquinol methylase